MMTLLQNLVVVAVGMAGAGLLLCGGTAVAVLYEREQRRRAEVAAGHASETVAQLSRKVSAVEVELESGSCDLDARLQELESRSSDDSDLAKQVSKLEQDLASLEARLSALGAPKARRI